jgi:glycosyltransferase involved in cell wall biosynthesis
MTMPMRVTFDSQIFCAQQFGGISRYFASLAAEMLSRGDVQPLIVAPCHINDYAARLPNRLVWGRRIARLPGAKPLARVLSLLASGAVANLRRSDIVHWTYYYPTFGSRPRSRKVLTVYDMIHERHPDAFAIDDPISRWKRAAVAKADHIICISQHTRKDLLQILEVPAHKVSVTHLGYDALAPLLTDETGAQFRSRTLGVDKPYFLFVGNRSGYKNFAGLMQAFASSSWLRQNFLLLCFGGGRFTEAEQALLARTGLGERVRHVGGPDSVLASCYRHAELLVYPSRYEGFGIPPLEAMSMNCPVACSNTTSLPEVVGDAAACFDPADTDHIRAVLESALEPTMREQLIVRGEQRSRQFSWARCAQETVDIYKEVLET